MSNKKLTKSAEKVLGGVCGGIANYFDISPIWVRLIWILLFFGLGVGLIAYIVLWVIMPGVPKKSYQERMEERLRHRG
jgi:phage shock protein PspC (stress-responsive transcriptional regulator)